MIFDCHAHLADSCGIPEPFFKGWSDTVSKSLPRRGGAENGRLLKLMLELSSDPDCVALLSEMELAGISRAALMVVDFGMAFDIPGWDIEAIHLRHKELMGNFPNLTAFSGVDPRRGRAGLALFERAVTEWGFSGLKVYPPCGFSPSDDMMFPYYEICRDLGLPVLVHIGPSASPLAFRFSQPMEIDRAAQNFPEVNFILGHAAVTQYQECGLMAQYRPNLYLDLSGFQKEAPDSFRQIMAWHLSKKLERRLLFGSDWPVHRLWGTQSAWVAALRGLQSEGLLSPAQLERIFSGNAMELFPEGRLNWKQNTPALP